MLTHVFCNVKDGDTCLHIARLFEHLEVVKFLVQEGGKELVSIKDKASLTALDYAKSQGKMDMVAALEIQ